MRTFKIKTKSKTIYSSRIIWTAKGKSGKPTIRYYKNGKWHTAKPTKVVYVKINPKTKKEEKIRRVYP